MQIPGCQTLTPWFIGCKRLRHLPFEEQHQMVQVVYGLHSGKSFCNKIPPLWPKPCETLKLPCRGRQLPTSIKISEEVRAQEFLRPFLQSHRWQLGKWRQCFPLISLWLVKLFCSVGATSCQEPSLIPICPSHWHFRSQWRGRLLLSQRTVSQELSVWFQPWTCIPMGTSKSMKTDLAAEAPWGLGSMCVSSFTFDFSHTLSPKLESCMENLVLGRGTTNPSALSTPHPFQSPNQKGQERSLARWMEQQFITVLQKRELQQAGAWGKWHCLEWQSL